MKSKIANIEVQNIPILKWTLVKSESESESIRETYKVNKDYDIVGTDETGDIIAKNESKLYLIQHDEPTSKPILLADNINTFAEVLTLLIRIPQYSIETPLSELEKIKQTLKDIKKVINKNLKGMISDEIEDLKELISDWKFYQTEEGKRFLKTESFKKEFYTKIDKPKKYRRIEVERKFKTNTIMIIGVCEKKGESKFELEKIIQTINCELPIELNKVYTLEEYEIKLEEHNEKKKQ